MLIYIKIILNIAPDKLNQKLILNNPVLSNPTKITLTIDTYKLSLKFIVIEVI